MATRISEMFTTYSARGIPSYHVEMSHSDLHKHRVIKGSDPNVVMRKALTQEDEWDAKWAIVQQRESERRERELEKKRRDNQKEFAAERTAEVQEELDQVSSILSHTLDIDDTIDWDVLKDTSPYSEPQPPPPETSPVPQATAHPREPSADDEEYTPRLGLLDHLSAKRKKRKIASARSRFQADHTRWKRTVKEIDDKDIQAKRLWQEDVERSAVEHDADVSAWEERAQAYRTKQAEANQAIDELRERYVKNDPEAVTEYCDMVLANSQYPDWFPREYDLDYIAESKALVVEYSLPSLEMLPTMKDVRYVQSKDEFVEKRISSAELNRLYDSVVYQVVLRSVHELFEADAVDALDNVVFNGWVNSIDPRTGNEVNACIVSLQTTPTEFSAINLANVEPKACFKSLKGVGSAKLHSLTAVAPIMQMRREDGRFVSAREVAETLDEGNNLALMDWEDFEHLIREVFEKEFGSSGGEVKVTQASRDGGVDAIAFDPDPIRGGKIVIQAKRYTNTVGVAAVRDLYGTVLNEGANKGILVTTSDYGPDAYAFAKDKPLTLLSGANLLHLLERHGHKARIDLKAARELLRGSGSGGTS